jgi:hypothetical protein
MKHIRVTSRHKPAPAQFEPILQLIGIFQALIGTPSILLGQGQQLVGLLSGAIALLVTASSVFGFDIPQKGGSGEQE